MNIQIFAKSKCFESKKAERWFKERRIAFQRIDLPLKGMSKGEIKSVSQAVGGLGVMIDETDPDAAVINYLAYEDAKIEKLIDMPYIIKTPIVRNGKQATVGFQPDIWLTWK